MIHEFNIEVMAEALYWQDRQRLQNELPFIPPANFPFKEWNDLHEDTRNDFKTQAGNVIAHYCAIYNKLKEKTLREEGCPITVNGVSFHIHPPCLVGYLNIIRLAGYSDDQIVSVTWYVEKLGGGILSPFHEALQVEPGMKFKVIATGNG